MTPMWTIQLLGGLSARHHDEVLTRFASKKAASLLAFLACYNDKPHSRETLIELLWPGCAPAEGSNRLSTLLTFLRHHLEPPGVQAGAVVQADRIHVRLNPDTLTTDVARFHTLLQRARRAPQAEERLPSLKQAIDLYAGDLLPGYFEEWVLTERARLKENYAQSLHDYAQALHHSQALELALQATHHTLGIDPYREPTARLQMRLYCALGQPAAALQTYRSFAHSVNNELGAAPSAATRTLAEQIQQDPQAVDQSRETSPAPTTSAPSLAIPQRSATEPEAASATAAQANLPVSLSLPLQLTRFFGREEQLATLSDLLTHSHPRLITLTGPGGVGKTRLAIQAARTLAETFEGRIWFVDLAALRDGRLLAFAIANALHLKLTPPLDPLEQVVHNLQEGPALLLLDNFEHLLLEERDNTKSEGAFESGSNALLVRLLLERAPDVKVLLTSRQPLHLGGEQQLPVPALPLPEQGVGCRVWGVVEEPQSAPNQQPQASDPHSSPPYTLLSYPSVALYVDRAKAARPDFALTANNAEVVAALCRKLEGMPLALEMAAAWAKTLPPASMLSRVEQQLDLLVSRRRDVPARQRSMRATLEWGYDLLAPELQEVFACLSVFRGGWTLEAAEAVCAEEGVVSLLSELADRSLVVVEESGRYRMLESVREYAEEKLEASGERAAVQRRHADYFLALAEEASPKLRLADQAQWLSRLMMEHDNLRAALAWYHTAEDGAQAGLQLAGALSFFWQVACYVDEGRARLAEVLAREGTAGRTWARARALGGAGGLALLQGDYESARSFHEQGLRIRKELGDKQGVANSLVNLGLVAYSRGDYESARTLYEQGLAIEQELGDKQGIAASLLNLGTVAYNQGDYEAARTLYEQSLTIQRELGDTWGVAYSLLNLGVVAYNQTDYKSARSLYEQSLAILQELGETQSVCYLLEAYAWLALAEGQSESAVRLLGASSALRKTIDATLPANVQAESDRNLAILREDLSEEAFQQAFSCGRTMTLEQAIKYALHTAGG